MSILEILLLAIGLSMDSFAVSVSSGTVMQKFSAAKAIKIALFLGVFQGLMPVIGWAAGEHFKSMIEEDRFRPAGLFEREDDPGKPA